MNEITDAIPHFVRGLEILKPLLDELDARGITSETVRQAAAEKGFSEFEKEWFRQAEGD